VKSKQVVNTNARRWFTPRQLLKRRDFYKRMIPVLPTMLKRRLTFHPIQFNPQSYLRDEEGIIPRDARMAK
jgi:hypothetical protein